MVRRPPPGYSRMRNELVRKLNEGINPFRISSLRGQERAYKRFTDSTGKTWQHSATGFRPARVNKEVNESYGVRESELKNEDENDNYNEGP